MAAATTSTAKTTTKARSSRATSKPKAEEIKSAFTVLDGLPEREYNLSSGGAHADFFDAVRSANADLPEGTPVDKQKYLAFPKPSKGVAAQIKGGGYRAAAKGEFIATNRTIGGVLNVLVTTNPEYKA